MKGIGLMKQQRLGAFLQGVQLDESRDEWKNKAEKTRGSEEM
jgi:hypothetical protein